MLLKRINDVKSRISAAGVRAGRSPDDIVLLAVTKTVPVEVINNAVSLGIKDIGENKVQEALLKTDALLPVKKHFIGHLQTNKAKKAVEVFDVIQSIDSEYLAKEINRHASAQNKVQECMIELKVSSEDTKFGVAPEKVPDLMASLTVFKNIRVTGLMAMAPYAEDRELARPYFRRAREVFESIKNSGKYPEFRYLSMGMSDDFETAIEEGANIVRIGTALFGERNYEK